MSWGDIGKVTFLFNISCEMTQIAQSMAFTKERVNGGLGSGGSGDNLLRRDSKLRNDLETAISYVQSATNKARSMIEANPAYEEAFICRRCIRIAAQALRKEDLDDWEAPKPTRRTE